MKFQDSSFNGLNVTLGTESVTHAPTHARTLQKQYAHQLFQSWGHNNFTQYSNCNPEELLFSIIEVFEFCFLMCRLYLRHHFVRLWAVMNIGSIHNTPLLSFLQLFCVCHKLESVAYLF